MSVEVACTCDDLPAHSHVYRTVNVAGLTVQREPDPYDVRIWVDWKAVAKELMR